jgi:hypothetical protein
MGLRTTNRDEGPPTSLRSASFSPPKLSGRYVPPNEMIGRDVPLLKRMGHTRLSSESERGKGLASVSL